MSSPAVSANLVLWSARICPWAQRATLALVESGLEHTIQEIDLQAKPSFYNEKINPASKVPVLQIGGKDENDEDVPRIPESGVLLELISDLAKVRGARSLTPEDPIERGEVKPILVAGPDADETANTAEARFFNERFHQVVQAPFMAPLYRGEEGKLDAVYRGLEEMQALLSKRIAKHGGPFWHGKEPGIADLGIAPFVGRAKVMSPVIEPLKSSDFYKTVFDTTGQFSTWAKYAEALMARESWSKTFDEEYVIDVGTKHIQRLRAAK